MPQILKHIDKIAREKKRDVLYIVFNEQKNDNDLDIEKYLSYDYKEDKTRQELLKWLDENNIPYEKCGPTASENGWESYRGQLYIDVPMDEKDERYLKLNEHLEDEKGDVKIEGIGYYFLPLKVAMKNAHHDEPGFWEKWAEDF